MSYFDYYQRKTLYFNNLLSCNEQAFEDAKPVYQDALEESGHATTLQFAGTNGASATTKRSEKRKRGRKIIWFTPPFSKSVKKNIGKKFLSLIRKHFPKHTAYTRDLQQKHCLGGLQLYEEYGNAHQGHNTALLNPKEKDLECNCRSSGMPSGLEMQSQECSIGSNSRNR